MHGCSTHYCSINNIVAVNVVVFVFIVDGDIMNESGDDEDECSAGDDVDDTGDSESDDSDREFRDEFRKYKANYYTEKLDFERVTRYVFRLNLFTLSRSFID